jgi:putative transposase
MNGLEPDKIWWTAAEIADARLTDLPATRQAVDKVIKREGWRESATLARPRADRGGGWEYHWKNFPSRAQRQLLIALNEPVVEKKKADRDAAWQFFEALPQSVKDKAKSRLLILQQVEALVNDRALGKYVAVNFIAKEASVAARSIWNWFEMVDGVRVDDRLPFLAPRHRAAPKRKATVHAEPEFMDLLKSDYLRPAGPSFATVYRRACRIAEKKGIAIVPERTAIRRYKAEVSTLTEVLCRKGVDALKRYYPAQTRDKTALAPLEVVNADFHRFDVFVEWPVERGQNEPAYIGRPQMVAFQDVFSGRILSWRVDQNPNRVAVALAAGDMIETWGIPEHVLMDNGREFAAKALTGGSPTRFRFKVKDTDPPGLFTELGCKIHWATPYSGQSKPIERAFRDMCDAIAKDPRFDGAYTGNTPMAKPEDYGSRAVPLSQFLTALAEGIEEHNTRVGRRSEVAMGRSFAQVFDEAYAVAPIRRATEAQRRLWLLGAEGVRAEARTGLIKFMGNDYWDAWMNEIAGDQVIVRFDPADFHAGLHVYSLENAYLGHAACKAKVGFFDTEEARAHAKARRDVLKAEKILAAAHRKFRAADLGRMLDEVAPPPSAPVEAKVVRPVFADTRARRPATPVPSPEDVAAQEAVQAEIVDMMQRLPLETTEEPIDRYRRARDLEAAAARGDELTRDQRRWLGTYQSTAEYAAHADQWAIFGDMMFG